MCVSSLLSPLLGAQCWLLGGRRSLGRISSAVLTGGAAEVGEPASSLPLSFLASAAENLPKSLSAKTQEERGGAERSKEERRGEEEPPAPAASFLHMCTGDPRKITPNINEHLCCVFSVAGHFMQ